MRGAKKAQDTYLELNTKLERRINEVTELQRLAEDRLRQEWISFKRTIKNAGPVQCPLKKSCVRFARISKR